MCDSEMQETYYGLPTNYYEWIKKQYILINSQSSKRAVHRGVIGFGLLLQISFPQVLIQEHFPEITRIKQLIRFS